MSAALIGRIVNDLLLDGLVRETAPDFSGAWRKAVKLDIQPTQHRRENERGRERRMKLNALMEQYRGSVLENVHLGVLCGVNEYGEVIFEVGNADHPALLRRSQAFSSYSGSCSIRL